MKISKLTGPENKKLQQPVHYTNIKKAVKTGNALLSYLKSGRDLGLAANQAGIMERVMVVRLNGCLKVMIDPHILQRSGEDLRSREGCLSHPGLRGDVMRSPSVLVDWIEVERWVEIRKSAEFTGMDAIVLQHVIDHLNGIRCTDLMTGKHMEGDDEVEPE